MFTINFTLTKKNYENWINYSIWNISKKVTFASVFSFTLIFAFLVFASLVFKYIFSQSLDFTFLEVIVSIFLPALLTIAIFIVDILYSPALRTRRLIKTQPHLLEKQKIVFSNKSLKVICKHTSYESDYSWFEALYEDEDCYYLVSIQKSAILIPKGAISDEQLEFLRSVIIKK
ncbi:MAG: YcxB family protein [bacterium]